jgi:hypothetical protein
MKHFTKFTSTHPHYDTPTLQSQVRIKLEANFSQNLHHLHPCAVGHVAPMPGWQLLVIMGGIVQMIISYAELTHD